MSQTLRDWKRKCSPIACVTIGNDMKPLESLTARQREILQLIAEGQSTKQIALSLNISVKTVETHRTQLMNRLQIHNIAGLVRYALRNDLIHLED